MILGAASCQKDITPGMEGDSTVSFSFVLPEEDVTKSYHLSTGALVDILYYEVYVGDDEMYHGTVNRSENGHFSLELKLVTGQTYDLLFWAQDEPGQGEPRYYNTDDLRCVRVHYDNVVSNEEKRDAFYGTRLNFTPQGIATNETVYLYRPFAQVNFATSMEDWNGASSFVDGGLQTQVTFDRLPNAFNVKTGDVNLNPYAPYTDNVVFKYALAPRSNPNHYGNVIQYNGQDYAWVAMNYILVTKDEMTVNAKAEFVHEKNTPASALTKLVPNVPVKQNYRTNILGEYFTGGNRFEIVIMPGFVNSNDVTNPNDDTQNPDYILTIPIRKTFELGGEVSLTENLTISSPFELSNGKEVKVNLNGYNITCQNGADAFIVTNGTLTIEDTAQNPGTVTTQDRTAGYGIIADGANAVVYVKGGNFVVGVDDVATYGEYSSNSAVYAKNGGKAYVSGGTFKVETQQTIDPLYKTRFLLNLKDLTNAGQEGNEIVVNGGTFYDFNPANNIAEGTNTNFVHADYKSVETSAGVWTVSKK